MRLQDFLNTYTGYAKLEIFEHIYDHKLNSLVWKQVVNIKSLAWEDGIEGLVKYYNRKILNWYFLVEIEETSKTFIIRIYLKDEE